jgi:methionyl-tRNA formyltransferase
MTAAEICSLVKACDHWNNGAITLYNGMEVKIRDASVGIEAVEGADLAGVITSTDLILTVHCAKNTQLLIHYLSVNDLVIAGRFANKYGFVKGQRFAYPSD